jgi:hypothetical protein
MTAGIIFKGSLSCNTITQCLLSSGLLFTAYEAEEIFEWLFESLDQTIGPVLRPRFTHRDSAIMPAMAKFCTLAHCDVVHRVCVFQKRTDFVKHVNGSEVCPVVREQGIRLFDEICDSKVRNEVMLVIDDSNYHAIRLHA